MNLLFIYYLNIEFTDNQPTLKPLKLIQEREASSHDIIEADM